jgi:hypothetical protein
VQEDEFSRPPSGSEIDFVRTNGWAELVERTRAAHGKAPAAPGRGTKRGTTSQGEETSATSSSSDDAEAGAEGAHSNSDDDGSSSGGDSRDSTSDHN